LEEGEEKGQKKGGNGRPSNGVLSTSKKDESMKKEELIEPSRWEFRDFKNE